MTKKQSVKLIKNWPRARVSLVWRWDKKDFNITHTGLIYNTVETLEEISHFQEHIMWVSLVEEMQETNKNSFCVLWWPIPVIYVWIVQQYLLLSCRSCLPLKSYLLFLVYFSIWVLLEKVHFVRCMNNLYSYIVRFVCLWTPPHVNM